MNRGKRTFVAGVLTLALGLCGAVLAQQTDTYLQRYDLAIENLDQAVAAVPDDSAKARSQLDHAVNALMSLSRDTTSATLVKAMENLFGRARTAVQNQSKTDIAVQTAVLAGGFRRLVYDAAFKAAVDGDMATAKARLQRIGKDMQLDAASMTAIGSADTVAALRLQTERAVARALSEEVSVAERLLPTDRSVAYQTLAEAYGTSLLVQDSPRLQAGFNQHFVDAAKALVAKDDTTFQQAAQAISAGADRLAQADQQALASASTTSASTAGAPAPSSAASGPSELPSVASSGSSAPSPAPAAGAATAPSAGASGATPGAAAPATAGQAATRAQVLADQKQQQLDTLTREVQTAGLPGPAGQRLAVTLQNAGVASLQAATQSLYAITAQASAALMAGDDRGARDRVQALSKRYDELLSPLVAAKDPGVDADMRTMVRRTADLVGLRLRDLNNLTAQTDAVARVVAGAPAPANLALNRAVSSWWAGWPRLLVLLVFGILVFVPLYLLNLAFGGGNRNWQLIGVALFLLLVPVVYEALAALGSMVATWTNNDAFEVLATYSMFQSSIGQVVWAGLIVLAILFAILGLYGICVQFGLLGRGRGRRGAGTTQTATTTATSTQERTDSMVDWDEEF
jgi:hypothetical protein